jgi:hypothetical protein
VDAKGKGKAMAVESAEPATLVRSGWWKEHGKMRTNRRTRINVAVFCGAWAGIALAFPPPGTALGSGAPKTPTARAFHLGFTAFPYDMTAKALTDVETFLHDNADILAVHMEGVPWLEASADKPFHQEMLNEWKRQQAAKPPGGKLYLALTPINNDRSDLAAYRSEREGLPMPDAFVGKAFDAPIVMDAYLTYCRRAIQHFSPDYLAIGIEANELFHKARAKWPAYVKLHRHVYAALKREHPKLPIFATFTLHNMLNADWADRREMLAAFKDLMPANDVVAASFYPFMANLTGQLDPSLQWVTREFDRYGKPYAITEMGQPAEPLVLESLKITLPGSPGLQRQVLAKTLGFAHARRTEFVIWFVPRDYDALWEKMRNTAPEFFKAWRDCGLQDGDGKPRPALELWKETLKLPYRPR